MITENCSISSPNFKNIIGQFYDNLKKNVSVGAETFCKDISSSMWQIIIWYDFFHQIFTVESFCILQHSEILFDYSF